MAHPFVHLHTHSHYSLLNALPKIKELVGTAKEHGANAIALTDNGNMYGAIEFYQACKKAEIKPILGIDAFVAVRTRFDKQAGVDNRRTRLVLLAENNAGYKNLIKLVTKSHLEGFYYRPRVDKDLLTEHAEGLIALISMSQSDVSQALTNHDTDKARELLKWYQEVYKDKCYLEITHHPEIENHMDTVKRTIDLAKEAGVPLVASHNVYYMKPGDKPAQETLMSVQSSGEPRQRNDTSDFSFISPEQANEYFKDIPEALENTQKIADMCEVDIELGTWYFPNFTIESGRTADDELRYVVYEGIKKRGVEETPELLKRVEYELEVIKTKGYSPYFLAVADLLHFAHNNKILTTIRGSVAGSMVTYLSGITNVNPFEYKLPFERFLNPERPSAPDIDMDYADTRRDEMIQYSRDKYGAEHVAQIGTFGTMMARGSVRDTARALGYPYETGDVISKMIPMGSQGFPMTIARALEDSPDLAEIYKKDEDARKILDMAQKIEGCARHIGVHAAGVVIAPEPLENFVPVQFDPKGEGKLITQYDMRSVGEDGIGLLKFDFLGLKNLSILADAIDRVEKIRGDIIDIEQIPLDDKKTFEMLARGETIGVFQLSGSGMTQFLKELRPSVIHDINAMVALYRPGPMESIPNYIQRKHNPHLVQYLDPRMEDILDQSYGVITYQDDVMMIAIKLAGYSWLEADKLRKAMGKKIPELMEEQKKKLHDGLLEHGMTEDKAQALWKLIEPFAAYGFNKAHAASYGRVAYQTAYMKANYPAIYMSAVLTADSGDTEKIAEIVGECNRMGIEVLPPDINESFSTFTVVPGDDKTIRFGLTTIKNFGEGIAKAITAERKENGPFTSLSDFLKRVTDKNLNRKSLEALVKSGAMDRFGDRSTLYANLERMLTYHKESIANGGNQDSLFAVMGESEDFNLEKIDPLPEKEILGWEKELLGLYVSGHPLESFRERIEKHGSNINHIKTGLPTGIAVIVAGVIDDVREIITKKNKQMAFVRISDLTGTIETVVFPKAFKEFREILQVDTPIVMQAKIDDRNGERGLLVDKIKVLE